MLHTLKPAALLLLALIFWPASSHASSLPVVRDFTQEAKESARKQAPIMVLFMSRSCTYCEIVLNDFLLPMQRDRSYDNKVILRQIETYSKDKLIDFNGKETTLSAFAASHKVWAVPTVVLFDSKGKVMSTIVGLLTVDFYLAYLDIAINDAQDKIKAGGK